MDEREFSSPVCYVKEEDIFGAVEPEPESDLKGFCDKCRTVLNTYFLDRETGMASGSREFRTDSHFLQDAVIKGCPLCSMLFEDIPPATRSLFDKSREASENDRLTSGIQIAVSYHIGRSMVAIYQQNDGNELFPSQYLRIVASDDTDFHYINEKPLGSSTGSEISMSAALMWMRNCTTTHHKCQQPSNFLPTRLIDVGEGQHPKPCLVLSVGLHQNTRYATLSHCWGSYIPCRLLKDSLSSLIKSIDVGKLPKTFQDALVVARNLRQRYIWIDALCIIQDDLEDWKFESMRMSEVYLRSVCNISATAAIDGSHGLFYQRDPTPLKDFTFHRDVGGTKRKYVLLNSNTWTSGVESAPLNQRAWVCQERILSPCNLHFGQNQLFWECREQSGSEILPRGGPSQLLSFAFTKQYISATLTDISEDQEKFLDSANETWRYLVQKYTSSKLTYSKDKLTAIGGLAALWARTTQDKYIAGLWGKDLPRQLLWWVSEPRDDHQDRGYIAPSWSWAATDGEVSWARVEGRRKEDVLLIDSYEAKITLNGEDSFGMVRNGHLTLNGKLLLAEMEWPERENHGDFGILVIVTSPFSPSSFSSSYIHSCWDVTYESFKKAERMDPGSQTRVFYLLPIVENREDTDTLSISGLILKATKEDPLLFQRTGSFYTRDNPHSIIEENFSPAYQYFNTKAAEMGFTSIDDENEGLKYKITII